MNALARGVRLCIKLFIAELFMTVKKDPENNLNL